MNLRQVENEHNLLTVFQGPKLTVLCRRQVANEFFFSVAKWKNLVAKKWFVKCLLHSETRKHLKTFPSGSYV